MILIHRPFHVTKNRVCKEGLLRESKRVGETYWNLWEMSMLEYEWKK